MHAHTRAYLGLSLSLLDDDDRWLLPLRDCSRRDATDERTWAKLSLAPVLLLIST
jgi:hypothetical protein